MGRVDGEVVGQDEDLLPQGTEHRPGQRLAVLRAEEVRPADGADHQRPSREERLGAAVDDEQVREVVRGVPGGGDRSQHDVVGELDLVAGVEGPVGAFELRASRREEGGALGSELAAPGEVVGVGVRVGGPGDPPTSLGGDGSLAVGEARWVDDESCPVAETDHVGRVAEPVLDDGLDLHSHRRTHLVMMRRRSRFGRRRIRSGRPETTAPRAGPAGGRAPGRAAPAART